MRTRETIRDTFVHDPWQKHYEYVVHVCNTAKALHGLGVLSATEMNDMFAYAALLVEEARKAQDPEDLQKRIVAVNSLGY